MRALLRERPLFLSARTRRLVDVAVLLAAAGLLLVFFRPGLLLSETTATGGDTGAHVYTPWYLRTHLLPRGLVSGWSPDWYGGFPVLHFYFPFVMVVQALLSFVLPYAVAFKIGTVLGVFFFPVSVYVFLRLLRFRFPTPAVGAVLSLAFLFMDSFQIYGGNIASTLAGEYSFSVGLGLQFVFLGLAYRISTGHDGRPLLAAVVLAVAVLSHLLPVTMIVALTPLLLYWAIRTHGARLAFVRLGAVFVLAFGLTAFWSVPFLARLSYAADMHWLPLEGWRPLFPRELWIYLGAGALGLVVAALRRDGRVLLLVVPAALGCLFYVTVVPGGLFDGKVWNGRYLPFWYLGSLLSTAYLVGTTIPTLARFLWRRRAPAVAVALLGSLAVVTGGQILRDKPASYVDDWIEHNYAGVEATNAHPVFAALMARIARLPPGRVMWEPSPDLGELGTPVALMTIPYWTGHPTMEGIYFESSSLTPFHFLTAAEVADKPSNPIPGLPYSSFDLERGRRHMELLDVTYFLSRSPRAQAAATAAGLQRIDQVGPFTLFRVDSPGQVVVPAYEPVVLERGHWIDENVPWFSGMSELDVPMARDGPRHWTRVPSFRAPLPRKPVAGGGRSLSAEVRNDELTFTTDAIGQPHWVKTSYFPNWKVDGADGPYQASPSMMIVIPTRADVRLHYERTWAEWLGIGATSAALTVLVAPAVRRRVARRTT